MLQVNVTLPVYNEEAQLASSVRRVMAFLAGQRTYRWEVVIADNGSTDGTLKLARGLAEERGGG
ncbi:MAG: glycosyltransferase [Verrucomicrobia bacterium]|nr:glycosyltransferase [Verrucomicrobiota bacterium]